MNIQDKFKLALREFVPAGHGLSVNDISWREKALLKLLDNALTRITILEKKLEVGE